MRARGRDGGGRVRRTGPVPVRVRWSALASAVVASVVLGGCGSHSSEAATVPLPDGPLESLVPQPSSVPSDLVPLLKATGPASLTRFASFAADPAHAAVALRAEGFKAAYVVEYADTGAGRILLVTVAQFATVTGAAAQLASQLASQSSAAGATPLVITPVGAGSAAYLEPLPGSSVGQLVSLRFRVGTDVFLVAVGAHQQVGVSSVVGIGQALATKAAATPSLSPTPAAS